MSILVFHVDECVRLLPPLHVPRRMSERQDAEFVAVPSQQANVVSADIDASSGIVHVIDRVILPEMQALRTTL